MVVDSLGRLYVAGYFSGSIDFDPGPAIDLRSTPKFSSAAFVLQLEEDGSFGWVVTFPGVEFGSVQSLSTVGETGIRVVMTGIEDADFTDDTDPVAGFSHVVVEF